MKAYVIVVPDNEISENGYKTLQESSITVGNDFDILRYEANPKSSLAEEGLTWNYPWDQPVMDIASGLLKSPYKTVNRNARINCALNHYKLWKKCYDELEDYLILEHDAIWKIKLPTETFKNKGWEIIGINDPRGATRKSKLFYDIVNEGNRSIQRPPIIDDLKIPQGLAGNSAYIIKPAGAKRMLDLVDQYGLWPNDAIMCRQLVPTLGVTKTFYTGVQGLTSTTSL